MLFIFFNVCLNYDSINLFVIVWRILCMLDISKKIKFGLLIVLSIVIYGYGQHQYQSGKSDAETAQYVADLEQFKSQVENLHAVSAHISITSERLNSLTDDIIKEYDNEINQNPLPADCVISDGRVRLISEIIRESSATRQSGSSLPTSRAAK